MKSSIFNKLLRNQIVLLLAVSVMLTLVGAYLSAVDTQRQLLRAETSIIESLTQKGQSLVINQSASLATLVADHAFSDIKTIVSQRVFEEPLVSYGLFNDLESNVWVQAITKELNTTSKNLVITPWALEPNTLLQRRVSFGGVDHIEFAAPVIFDSKVLGYIRFALNLKESQQLRDTAQLETQVLLAERFLQLVFGGLIAVIFGYWFSRRFAKKITSPIADLTRAAQTIVDGHYDATLSINGTDEIAILTTQFNTMTLAVRRRIHDLQVLNECSEQIYRQDSAQEAMTVALNSILKKKNTIHDLAFFLQKPAKAPALVWSTLDFCQTHQDLISEQLAYKQEKIFQCEGMTILWESISEDLKGAIAFVAPNTAINESWSDFAVEKSIIRALLRSYARIWCLRG